MLNRNEVDALWRDENEQLRLGTIRAAFLRRVLAAMPTDPSATVSDALGHAWLIKTHEQVRRACQPKGD
jgi:hypothetical protein